MARPEERAPPAGGFGAPEPGQRTELVHHATKTVSGPARVVNTIFVAMGIFVALMVGGGFLFAWGKGRAARGAEARVNVRRIGERLELAFTERGTLCPSARTVPADFEHVRGKSYQSSKHDWQDDPGWACTGFEMEYPQRYQYRVETTESFVTIVAAGDLDGDDVRSTYTLRGHVDPQHHLVFDSAIEQSNDGE